jgi:hypothetical protein
MTELAAVRSAEAQVIEEIDILGILAEEFHVLPVQNVKKMLYIGGW